MSSPDMPDYPSPPPPEDTEVYDENGKLVSSITHKDGKAIYRAAPLTPAEQAQRAEYTQRQNELLDRIYNTPAENIQAAQDEADAFAESARISMGKGFKETMSALDETMSARGLLGSKAYSEGVGDITEQRLEKEKDLGLKTTAMRENLLAKKTARDVGLYNLYGGALAREKGEATGNRAFTAGFSGQEGSLANQRYSNEIAGYNAQLNAAQLESQLSPWNQYVMPIVQTGAMAYGMKK